MTGSTVLHTPTLVTPDWLAEELFTQDLCIIDASWYLPTDNRNPQAEFDAEHIPGALFFDIDAIADHTSDLPHMLPSEQDFSSAMTNLGISNNMRIVVYDGHGLMSAARVWWTFRVFGHTQVSVLNGGFPAWKTKSNKVISSNNDNNKQAISSQPFKAHLNSTLVRSLNQMRDNLSSQSEQVIDARPSARFNGAAPEPRPGLHSGHMPGSFNIPFGDLLDPATNTMLPPEQITARLVSAGLDLQQPITASCGSGITATVLALALYTIEKNTAVYDGSWAEWGSLSDTAITTKG